MRHLNVCMKFHGASSSSFQVFSLWIRNWPTHSSIKAKWGSDQSSSERLRYFTGLNLICSTDWKSVRCKHECLWQPRQKSLRYYAESFWCWPCSGTTGKVRGLPEDFQTSFSGDDGCLWLQLTTIHLTVVKILHSVPHVHVLQHTFVRISK